MQNPDISKVILELMEKYPSEIKFGQPCDSYHNSNRKFVSWHKIDDGSDQLYQGEVDKTSGQPDGKVVLIGKNSL